jgi:(R,R)-butanediol dehydrogenase/meso-butanediol dehydrogenase/diacetyl reductase
VEITTALAHVCDRNLPEAIDLLATTPIARQVVDSVIGLDDLVPEGLERLADGDADGKILVDVRR